MTSTFECSKKWGDYRWNRDLVNIQNSELMIIMPFEYLYVTDIGDTLQDISMKYIVVEDHVVPQLFTTAIEAYEFEHRAHLKGKGDRKSVV